MRETYDCAVVLVPGHGEWLAPWLERQNACSLRVGYPRMHMQQPVDDCGRSNCNWLKTSALALRRFDVCLLPVEPGTLSWVRTALATANTELDTPVIALVRNVGAVAMRDLLPLGLDDFMRPDCGDEMRVRIALSLRRRQRLFPAGHPVARPAAQQDVQLESGDAWVYDVRRDRFHDAPQLNEAVQTYDSDTGAVIDTALVHAPFGVAKARIVGHFERTYLHCSLARHDGNVTQAARSACKHRRAFWALMRKHRIQAAPYRELARERPPEF